MDIASRIGTVLVPLAVAFGCVSTSVTAYKDPQFADTRFSNMVVYVDSGDLQWRSFLESALSAEISAAGGDAVSMISLVPPTTQTTPDDLRALLNAAKIEAVVYVTISDAGVNKHLVPQTTHTVSSGAGGVAGDVGSYAGTSSSYSTGGYTSNERWAKIDATILDLQSGRKVWVSSATAEGQTGWASFDHVRQAYARMISRRMAEDQMW